MKVSNCCGVESCMVSLDGPDFEDIGICPQCKEHCGWENIDDEEDEDED